jgi:hypothetical protein
MIGIFSLLNLISDMEITGSLNSITFSEDETNIKIEYKVGSEFNQFINSLIPIVIISFQSEEIYEFILSFFPSSSPNFVDSFYMNFFSDLGQSSLPRTSSIEQKFYLNKFFDGIAAITALFGAGMTIIGTLLAFGESIVSYSTIAKLCISTLLFGFSLGIFLPTFLTSNKNSPSYLLGLNIGILLVFLAVTLITADTNNAKNFLSGFGWEYLIISALPTLILAFGIPDLEIEMVVAFSILNIINNILGIATVIFGVLAIQTINDPKLKFLVQNIFIIITWITIGFIGVYTQWFIAMYGD